MTRQNLRGYAQRAPKYIGAPKTPMGLGGPNMSEYALQHGRYVSGVCANAQ